MDEKFEIHKDDLNKAIMHSLEQVYAQNATIMEMLADLLADRNGRTFEQEVKKHEEIFQKKTLEYRSFLYEWFGRTPDIGGSV